MESLDEVDKTRALSYLGGETIPLTIYLYPVDFESKDAVLEYLNDLEIIDNKAIIINQ